MLRKTELGNLRYLSKKQCAQYMNLDIALLNGLIKSGYLPVAKLGSRTFRIDRLDADRCITEMKSVHS